MSTRIISPRTFAFAFLVLIAGATPSSAQDQLSKAKQFYASAAYEDALQVLTSLKGSTPNARTEAAAYEVFCLLALDRADEARQAITAIVQTDPLYRPSETVVSPRVRTFFEDVRRPLLPEQVKSLYARSKDAYDQKKFADADAGFDRTIALIDELGAAAPADVKDLRTVALGFRDLAKTGLAAELKAEAEKAAAEKAAADKAAEAEKAAAATRAATPQPPNPAAPTVVIGKSKVPTTPRQIFSADDKMVTPPIAIARVMPQWVPSDAVEAKQKFSGVLEIVIGEDGRVLQAMMVESLHPKYDPMLLEAARDWTFKAAKWAGVPVPYRYRIALNLGK
jgi:hypothetical protein